MFTVANVATAVDDIRGDILDHSKLEAAMVEFAPEVVFHMAAQPLVRRSYSDPVETYATNVMGTVHVLEAIRKSPSVRAVVSVTTDKCYENKEWVWPYRENDPLGGYDPYSSSKACAEIVSAAYRSSFFPIDSLDQHYVALATARAGNVIGGGGLVNRSIDSGFDPRISEEAASFDPPAEIDTAMAACSGTIAWLHFAGRAVTCAEAAIFFGL